MALGAFVGVGKQILIEGAECGAYFAILLLEGKPDGAGAKGRTKADNLPGLYLALAKSEKGVLPADSVGKGENFGAGGVDGLRFHYLTI